MRTRLCLSARIAAFATLLAASVQPAFAEQTQSIGTEGRYKFDSTWVERCAVVGLVATSSRRSIVHFRPEPRDRPGALRNNVLFEGKKTAGRFAGTVTLADPSCPGGRVSATGTESENFLRITLDLDEGGLATSCPAYSGPRQLVFDFLQKVKQQPPNEPTSVETRNWGAITPQAEPDKYREAGYAHIYDWPTWRRDVAIRDRENMVVPAFGSRVAGAGLWWHWMLQRGRFTPDEVLTLRTIAERYSGVKTGDPVPKRSAALRKYTDRYPVFSCLYFDRRLGLDDPIRLGSATERWALARVMFHHEAAGPVDLERQEFENGIRLAEDFMAGKLQPIAAYDRNYRP